MTQPHTPAAAQATTSAAALGQQDAAAISAACASSASHVAIEIVAQTGSTNADLLARIDTLAGPTLRIAHQQTAGRGRAGRSWLSAPGAALMFSLAWRFKGPLHRMSGLPMAVGVALAETMGSLGVPVQIKWPNDLLRDGAKLAGILVESQSAKRDTDGAIWAVIGVGMNLLMPDQLEAQIGRSVAAAPWLAQMPRQQLVAALLSRLAAVLAEFDDTGFAPFCERWNALHAWHGREVVILDHDQVLQQAAQPAWTPSAACCSIRRRAGSKCYRATSRCASTPHAGAAALTQTLRTNMILLIDAGNTRVKWALVETGAALGAWYAHGASAMPTCRNWNCICTMPWPNTVSTASSSPTWPAMRCACSWNTCCSVPSRHAAARTDHQLVCLGGRTGRLQNGYRNPAQLGCDRFAAAIAGHALAPGTMSSWPTAARRPPSMPSRPTALPRRDDHARSGPDGQFAGAQHGAVAADRARR
jgi:BirA family biotin operon repressor/biotin-[acetyl-CoA-carboxylase] ligase